MTRFYRGLVLVVFAFLFSILAFGRTAGAHSFYLYECCSSQDRWPMGDDVDAKEPDPQEVAGGFLTHDGVFVREADARISPDGQFHVCRHGGRKAGGVIQQRERPICLWVPGKGS